VYAITHVATGDQYIGASGDIDKRWQTHLALLRQGTHSNKDLQARWTEAGEAAFVFTVIEVIENLDELGAAERRHMDRQFKERGNDGFNKVTRGADVPLIAGTWEDEPAFDELHGYMSSAAAAARLGINPSRVRQLALDGILEEAWLGDRRYLTIVSVEHYTQSRPLQGNKHRHAK